MSVNAQLTDRERVELTKKAYDELQLGDTIKIDQHYLGTVCRNVYAKDGMRAFVISSPNEITILFKGSYGFKKGTPQTWRDEWIKTNLPILKALLARKRTIPSQLKSAAHLLNQTINQFRKLQY